MKNLAIYILSIILGVYFLSSCAKQDFPVDKFISPTISLMEPAIQADGTIILKCSVELNDAIVPSSGFEYGLKGDLTDSRNVESIFERNYFYAEVSDVTPGEEYYYRAYVKNERNTITTEVESFFVADISPVEIGGLAWAATNVEGEDGHEEEDSWYYTWDEAMSACPDGWRLPTEFELNDLLKLGTTWKDSEANTTRDKAGRWLGSNHSRATASNPGVAIFLPASGYRNNSSGNLNSVNEYGSYWSSTPIGDNSWYMSFSSSNIRTEYNAKTYRRSVRCVEGLIYSPRVSTEDVTDIEATTATLEGEVTSNGGTEMIERGFVYSTTDNPPSLGDYNTTRVISTLGTGLGEFTKEITSLIASKTYYVRAYAANHNGTSYGDVKAFTTIASDPPVYTEGSYSGVGVNIDGLWWAQVNVGYTAANPYGLLFNWGVNIGFAYGDVENAMPISDGTWALQDQGPCPDGWRVPTEAEYNNLLTAANSPVGTTDSYPGQWRDASDDNPFGHAGRWFGTDCKTATKTNPGTAVFFPAAGDWYDDFYGRGTYGIYWSTTSGRNLYFLSGHAYMYSCNVGSGFPLRCVQN